jgi:hypothetical protein
MFRCVLLHDDCSRRPPVPTSRTRTHRACAGVDDGIIGPRTGGVQKRPSPVGTKGRRLPQTNDDGDNKNNNNLDRGIRISDTHNRASGTSIRPPERRVNPIFRRGASFSARFRDAGARQGITH